jgi:hypothetical protein
MTKELRTITRDQLIAELTEKFGVDKEKWAFKCPACGHIQTVKDFIDIGVNPEHVNFNCIGRYAKNTGGCNWTLGGLLTIHRLLIIHTVEIDVDGMKIPCFEIA